MPTQVDPFRAVAISRLAHALSAQGQSVIHMEFGQPSTGAPARAIELAHRVLDTDGMGYWESPELKSRLALHYERMYGIAAAPERFILTCGASPALVLSLAANFDVGDHVALARPGYVAYRNTLRALNFTPVEIPCGADTRFQLTAAMIAALEPVPKGLIIASPANPTGTIIGADELRGIARVCAERGIRIISDEIYHGLSYVEPARSMGEFDAAAFLIGSFSKYFSMVGWRLGWLVVPAEDEQRVRSLAANMFLTAPSLSQHAGLAALDSRPELDAHVEVYRRNRALLLDALPRLGLDEVAPPDGAFYLYVDVHRFTMDSLHFCERLLRDTGVATAPGIDFDPVEGSHFIRFSFAVSTAQTHEAIARLKPWFRSRAEF